MTDDKIAAGIDPGFIETKPITLDAAGRPVDADGIPLFGPGRAQAIAERAEADRKAAAKAAREAAKGRPGPTGDKEA